MRKLYEMSDEQYKALVNACRPVTYIVIGGVAPKSQQQNANEAWQKLGLELGFDWETVEPSQTKGNHFFYAKELEGAK